DSFSSINYRMIAACHTKCISPAYLQDGDLNKGEGVCLDRCVYKFLQTNAKVTATANDVG
ncbi:hypothetical protein BC830DRAFT_1056561, partial [Chytriomyces sp. MP71]